jgi:hypothetical protein
MVENPTPKLQEMRNIVKEELKHVPKGRQPQQELRMLYQMLRMHSLGKKGKGESREDVLKEAIASVKKRHRGFEPKYDADYFAIPD